jgi:hypothetical protein
VDSDFLVRVDRFFGRKRLTDVVKEAIEQRNLSKQTALRKIVSTAIDDLAASLKKKGKALSSKTSRDTARPLTAFLIENAPRQLPVIEALLRIWMEHRPATEILSVDTAVSSVGVTVTINSPDAFSGADWSVQAWTAFQDGLRVYEARFPRDFAAVLRTGLVPSGTYAEFAAATEEKDPSQQPPKVYAAPTSKAPPVPASEARPSSIVGASLVLKASAGAGLASGAVNPPSQPVLSETSPTAAASPSSMANLQQGVLSGVSPLAPAPGFGRFIHDCIHRLEQDSGDESWWPDEEEFADHLATFKANATVLRTAAIDRGARSMRLQKALEDLNLDCANGLALLDQSWLLDAELVGTGDCDPTALALDLHNIRTHTLAYESSRKAMVSSKQREFEAQAPNVNKQAEEIDRLIERLRPHLTTADHRRGLAAATDTRQTGGANEASANEDEGRAQATADEPLLEPKAQLSDDAGPAESVLEVPRPTLTFTADREFLSRAKSNDDNAVGELALETLEVPAEDSNAMLPPNGPPTEVSDGDGDTTAANREILAAPRIEIEPQQIVARPSAPPLAPKSFPPNPETSSACRSPSAASSGSGTVEADLAKAPSSDALLLADLISKGQIEAAYWLLMSDTTQVALRPETLRILIGAELIKRESDDMSAEIEAEVREFSKRDLELNRNEKLLVCAGAARLVFLLPSMIQPQMFEMPDGLPLTSSFLHSLGNFATLHRSLTRLDLEQTARYLELKTEEREKMGLLGNWWSEAQSQTLGDVSCTKVWRKICGSAMQPCVEAAQHRRFHSDLFNREPWTLNGHQQIRAYCRRIGAEATSEFSHGLLDRTIRDAKNLIDECALATERLVEGEKKVGHNGRGLLALRSEAESATDSMRAEWESFLQKASGLHRAAGLCVARALEQVFEEFLRVSPPKITNKPEAPVTRVPSIERSLENTLLLFPDLERDADDEPKLSRYASLLRAKPINHREPSTICREWIQAGAFDSARNLAALIPDENFVGRLQAEIAEALPIARSKLIRYKQDLSDMLEIRFLDECISENERAELDSMLLSVQPGEVAQFPPQHRTLDQVREAINAFDLRTRARFSERWAQLRPDLDRVDATDEQKAEYSSLVEMNLDRGSFRSMDELFSFLETAADEGGPLDPALLPIDRADDHLDVFLNEFSALSELAEASPSAIAAKIGEQGRSLFERWMSLHRLGFQNLDKLVGPVSELLTLIGFVQSKDQPPAARPEQVGGTMVRLRVPMSINHRDARPFWQFGSRSKTTNVLLVWPSQGSIFSTEKMVRQILDSKLVGAGPGLLVLYFGRLALEKRRLRTDPQSDDVEFPVAILDDILLLHLAGLVESRASTLLRCSLPFAAANPYIDSGQVLQEMFFGRTGQAASLQRYPGGQSIIYGGRQLGKSALLDQVEREFNDPSTGAMAIVKDIKSNFAADGGSDPNDLWQVLLGEFRDRKLVPSSAVSKVETILRYLTDSVSPSTGRAILVMLDEADRFLMADRKNGFRVVSELRQLVRSTEGRLRFVFAGLSTVARFQGTPNNPLVQFGEPLCIGPLPPADARDLVMEPLRACGLRFERDEDALLVLASTNYHSKLIQYFCKRLVRRMHEKQFRSAPPYLIRRSDIEAVSQAREFGEQSRKIFDLTVRVDIENRYRAVVLSLAYDSMDPRKTRPRSYTPLEVADSVGNWWKQAFPKATGASDDLQCLLTEMCGMGLLIRDRAGKYRLRSPNLVRLLGDRHTIETQLLELEGAPVRLQADSESGRGQLDDGSYSCFTYVQERGIRQTASGIVLVTGSRAHGLACIREALRRAGPNLDAPCEIIPPEETPSATKLKEWLNRKILPVALKSGAVTCVCYLPANDIRVTEFVEQGSDFCNKQKQIRLVFVLPPKALLDWLRLPKDVLVPLEGAFGFVAAMRRWNAAGVRQRLLDCETPPGESEISEILSITGGWHILVEEVFRTLAKQRDISKVFGDIRSRWEAGALRKELRLGCGLEDLGENISFIQTSVAAPDVHGVGADVLDCLRRLDSLSENGSGIVHVESRVAEALRRP